MAIKTYKPYTPSRRFMSNLSSEDITAKPSVRGLLTKLPVSAGRNNCGRITSRHKGGGAKKLYLSLIHISEPTRPFTLSRMPSSA